MRRQGSPFPPNKTATRPRSTDRLGLLGLPPSLPLVLISLHLTRPLPPSIFFSSLLPLQSVQAATDLNSNNQNVQQRARTLPTSSALKSRSNRCLGSCTLILSWDRRLLVRFFLPLCYTRDDAKGKRESSARLYDLTFFLPFVDLFFLGTGICEGHSLIMYLYIGQSFPHVLLGSRCSVSVSTTLSLPRSKRVEERPELD